MSKTHRWCGSVCLISSVPHEGIRKGAARFYKLNL